MAERMETAYAEAFWWEEVGFAEGHLCDSILGKGFMDTDNGKLLRKKRVAEVKSRKAENYQM